MIFDLHAMPIKDRCLPASLELATRLPCIKYVLSILFIMPHRNKVAKLIKYLGLAEKLIKENFLTVRKISFSVEDDPETFDKWVVADIEVYGEIDQVIAWEDEFVKEWVATVPYPERNMIRLSCDII
ncbi:MAG: hypothetical protein KAT52_06180 [Desulfobacterales bacterium]|nr:hypothetical protein [Desulfobacterales bacterium]